MKKILFLILATLTIFTFSCKKENDYHKVKYHVIFIEDCEDGYSNDIDIACSPHYSDEEPTIYPQSINADYEWEYEYWKLQDGDEIMFIVSPQQGYRFIMSVYIDDVLMSFREIKTHYGGYYITTIEDEWGLNNESDEDMGIIEFYYYE